MDTEELKSLIILNSIDFLTPRKIKNLIDKFRSAKNILCASFEELVSTEGITENIAKSILSSKSKIDPDKEIEVAIKNKVKIISYFDKDYPEQLRNLPDPPSILYVKGNLNKEDKISLAIVGTRRSTSYGRLVTEYLIKELADYKFTIVSGLAYGIDTFAHEYAIKNNLKTIAVLGNGIGVYYPITNKKLQDKIPMEGGCLISEFPYYKKPNKLTFPQRNRIIAALSLATVVVEADIQSGALITAKFACDLGREVFAIPGSIFSKQSRGPNFLIKEGAKIVTSVEDIIEEIMGVSCLFKKDIVDNKNKRIFKNEIKMTDEEKRVLEIIHSAPEGIHIDKLQNISKMEIKKLLSIVLKLQILGKIREVTNKTFISLNL